MYVCIKDWGQSVIRDEMRFYGWWNLGEMYLKTHIERHECEIISIDTSASIPKSILPFIPFQFQFYPLDEHCRGMLLTNIECEVVFDKFWGKISIELKDESFGFDDMENCYLIRDLEVTL